MGTTANQIENHIERTRENLGSNIQELEEKVRSVTDWRHHYQENPLTMIGLAFGGGVLIAGMIGGRKKRRYSVQDGDRHSVISDRQKDKALETWDNIKGALIGVAASRFKEFVGDVVPGFNEQLQHTSREPRPSPPEMM
jgi:hypothetical protein